MHRWGWAVDERASYVAFGYKQSYDMLINVISQLQKLTYIGPLMIAPSSVYDSATSIAQVYDGTKHS